MYERNVCVCVYACMLIYRTSPHGIMMQSGNSSKMLPAAIFAAMRNFTKKVFGVVSNASGAIDRPSININTKLHAMVGCLLCRELHAAYVVVVALFVVSCMNCRMHACMLSLPLFDECILNMHMRRPQL